MPLSPYEYFHPMHSEEEFLARDEHFARQAERDYRREMHEAFIADPENWVEAPEFAPPKRAAAETQPGLFDEEVA